MKHHVSESCQGENCTLCGAPATHKVGEEIMKDDPQPVRHNLTSYICCHCFVRLFGRDATLPCQSKNTT
jgi:hypothetical protein